MVGAGRDPGLSAFSAKPILEAALVAASGVAMLEYTRSSLLSRSG